MIQDVLMDRYEEVVLVDLSPNKLYRSEGGDGWLIHRCNHEAAALSPCYISENKNKTQTNLGGKKKASGPPLLCGRAVSYGWLPRAKYDIKQTRRGDKSF